MDEKILRNLIRNHLYQAYGKQTQKFVKFIVVEESCLKIPVTFLLVCS